MQGRRVLYAIALFLGWPLLGIFSALVLTILFAFCLDPHGTGPIGEGFAFLMFFAFAALVGVILGFLRASILWSKRAQNAEPKTTTT